MQGSHFSPKTAKIINEIINMKHIKIDRHQRQFNKF